MVAAPASRPLLAFSAASRATETARVAGIEAAHRAGRLSALGFFVAYGLPIMRLLGVLIRRGDEF